jgi:hypothetical protein
VREQPKDLFQRWGISNQRQLEDLRQWVQNAQFGDVCPESINSTLEYGRNRTDGSGNMMRDAEQWHSFANVPAQKDAMTFGTTHVAVGFVDLGMLLYALYDQPVDLGEPLRWVGYEMSAYACAKTMVITQMLLQGAPTDSILEVCRQVALGAEERLSSSEIDSPRLGRSGTHPHGATRHTLHSERRWPLHMQPRLRHRRSFKTFSSAGRWGDQSSHLEDSTLPVYM